MYKIRVDSIPPGGIDLDLASGKDAWLTQVLDRLLPDPRLPDDHIRFQVQLLRSGDHVDMCGGLYLSVHRSCDRCLATFPFDQQIPLHIVWMPGSAPVEAHSRYREDAHEETAHEGDDCQVALYESGVLDCEAIVMEQLVLAQPMQYLCSPECLGLCPTCGANRNEAPCACPERGHRPASAARRL